MDNLGEFGLKVGMFSHGYHISDEISRKNQIDNLRQRMKSKGTNLFLRGEQDGEWKVCGWFSRNPEQAFYWSSIYAVYCGLDVWNIPADALYDDRFLPAIDFFNRYAGCHEPSESKSAFCALRKGLNAADVESYPESEFGEAKRSNKERYLAIAECFAKYGAYQGDPEKALGTGMKNRQRDDYNDVGWNIFPGNFEKFLYQIDPDETSSGLWHVGQDEIYGRFARSFEFRSGKTVMDFRLDKAFFTDDAPHQVNVEITYYDKGTGKWSFVYYDADGEKTVGTVSNSDTCTWKKQVFSIDNVSLSGYGNNGADFSLKYIDGDDTIFHMLELVRL